MLSRRAVFVLKNTEATKETGLSVLDVTRRVSFCGCAVTDCAYYSVKVMTTATSATMTFFIFFSKRSVITLVVNYSRTNNRLIADEDEYLNRVIWINVLGCKERSIGRNSVAAFSPLHTSAIYSALNSMASITHSVSQLGICTRSRSLPESENVKPLLPEKL